MVIKRRAVQQTTWLFILVSGLAHAQGSPACLAAGLSPIGPITLNSTSTEMHPVVNAYVVAAADTSVIQVIVERINTSKRENVLVRVFDPDEKLVYWRYADPSSAVYPAEDLKVLINTTVTPTRAGIYQVRVSSVMNAQVTLGLPAGTGYGLSYGNGTFSPWPGQPTPLWVHAPVHPTRTMRLSLLKVTKPFDVFDVTEGVSLGSVGIGSRTLSLAPSSTTQSHLWRFDLPTSAWSFSATDMPLILCSSQAAAEAIYASVERIPSGPMSGFLVAHKLGLEIAEILPQLLAGMGDGDALYAMANNYPATQPACLAPKTLNEANRRSILVTTILPGVRWALGRTSGVPNQVVDPASPWAGAFGMPWIQGEACTGAPDCPDSGACTGGVCQSFDPNSARWDLQRWVNYRMAPGQVGAYGGIAPMYGEVPHAMTVAATMSDPCNPYGPPSPGGVGKKELIYRAAAMSLVEFLGLSEDDRWFESDDPQPYPGGAAFMIGQKTLPNYGKTAAIARQVMTEPSGYETLGERLHRVWTAGLRHVLDRRFTDYIVSSMNQSAHYVLAFSQLAQGTGELEDYRRAQTYAARFLASGSPSGWFEEAYGPDATYVGMTNYHLGIYSRIMQAAGLPDGAMRAALMRDYTFFNHTVALEPDGTRVGSSDFSHRTPWGFFAEQWDGARKKVEDIPEIGLWTPVTSTVADLAASIKSSSGRFNTNSAVAPIYLNFSLASLEYEDLEGRTSGPLPVELPAPYRREYDDLLAIKQPGYYAVVYTGAPGSPVGDYARQQSPFPEETSGAVLDNTHVYAFAGGGLSLLSTPQFGTGVFSTNWSPLMRHGLLAEFGGLRYWEIYASTKRLASTADSLVMGGRVATQKRGATRA